MAGILKGEGVLEVFNWVKEGADKIGAAAGKLMDGLAEVHDVAVAGIGSIGRAITGALPSLPSTERAVAEAPKIEAPQVTKIVDPHHVDMGELGSFSPQTFGGQAASVGRGGSSLG